MRTAWVRVLALFAAFSWLGCGASGGDGRPSADNGAGEDVKQTEAPLINGVDNRVQFATHPDASLRQVARWSSAVMMTADKVNVPASGPITYNAPTLQQLRNVCDGQRFVTEQAPGTCSATLIDDNLVLTSANCISAATCANTRFVFNFFRTSDTSPTSPQTAADVYSCQSVVVSQTSPANYAIVQLDRAATPNQWPASVRTNRAPLAQGLPVAVVGFPDGIPVKIASGGIVINQSTSPATTLVTNLDAFAGTSGAGVYYTDTYDLAAVINSPNGGVADYVPGPAGSTPAGCNVPQICSEVGCSPGPATASYVGPAIDAYCAINPSNLRLCSARDRFYYSATNGSSYHQSVFLEPGSTLDVGTCTTLGSSAVGDTTLSILYPDGSFAQGNDDACGLGGASWTNYTVPTLQGGRYELVGSCYGTNSCAGTMAYTVKGLTGGSFSYTASNTNSAMQNTFEASVHLRQGDILTAGTCGMENAGFAGDTYLRFEQDINGNPFNRALISQNDDACGGLGSQLSYVAPSDMDIAVVAGCYSATSCNATVSYKIGERSIPFSVSNTNSAQQNTVNQTLHLLAGSKVTAGTCGLPGASFTGDTFVRMYQGATQVAASDDACDFAGSRFTFRPTVDGDYSFRIGCFGTGACSGNAVVRVVLNTTGNDILNYSGAATNGDTINTANKLLFLRAGDNLTAATCPGSGFANGTGDTYLRLLGPTGLQIAESDDNCPTGSNPTLSSISGFNVLPEAAGSYELRGGCFGGTSCTGEVELDLR